MSEREATAIIAADGSLRLEKTPFPPGTRVRIVPSADSAPEAARLPAEPGAEHGWVEHDERGRRLPYPLAPSSRLPDEVIAEGNRRIAAMREKFKATKFEDSERAFAPEDWNMLRDDVEHS